MPEIAFNGKFLSAAPTGVHRVAEEIIRAVDALIAEESGVKATILHPANIRRELPLLVTPHRRVGRATGPLWEQSDLPRAAGDRLLINLCNLGPVVARRSITMIHDAQVRDAPSSYSAPFRGYYNAIQPVLGRRNEAILTVSEFSKARLIHYGLTAASRIHVIPNGVDHVSRTPPDRRAARRFGLQPGGYVLALANGQPHKNIGVLIEAFRQPELSDVTLVLFGDAPLEEVAPNAGPNVVALGRIGDAALYGLMADAAAFACPSLTEGFGLPPLEAMAMGAPVVASPRGALRETLGDAAIYADPRAVSEWVEAFAVLTAFSSARACQAAAGQTQAARFRWDAAARAILNLTQTLPVQHRRAA